LLKIQREFFLLEEAESFLACLQLKNFSSGSAPTRYLAGSRKSRGPFLVFANSFGPVVKNRKRFWWRKLRKTGESQEALPGAGRVKPLQLAGFARLAVALWCPV